MQKYVKIMYNHRMFMFVLIIVEVIVILERLNLSYPLDGSIRDAQYRYYRGTVHSFR